VKSSAKKGGAVLDSVHQGATAMNWRHRRYRRLRGRTVEALAWVAGAVLVAMVAAGCAVGLTRDSSDEAKRETAKARAQARWDLLVSGNIGAAYEFLSKSSKQVVSRQEFVNRSSKFVFRSAAVQNVECEREACKVTVYFTYDHPLKKGVGNTAREDWIIDEGQIWYVWSL